MQSEKNTFQLSVMGLTDRNRYTSTIVNINLESSFVLDCGLKSNYMYWWEEYFTKFQELYENINEKSSSLESNISTGVALNTALEENFGIGNELYQNILTSISNANEQNNNLVENNEFAETNYSNLISANTIASENIDALTSANFDASEILNGVEDVKSYIGYTDSDILGLQIDLENKIFTRLSGAVGLTLGDDFDQFNMFGGRKRCCVADDGTINAWYGDDEYIEDGSNGQVMVYQPKFYYRVVPLKIEAITDGVGYHLRKANYYISDTFKTGFKIHPAFIDKNGDEIDYILFSAYEGSIYDSSENEYIVNNAQIMELESDKFCSISNVQPATGTTQSLNRANIETLAQNRGLNWHCDLIKTMSLNLLLMIIETGELNLQNTLGIGVTMLDNTDIPKSTGLTESFGNSSGIADGENGYISMSYRGIENPWGNIWKFVNGINFYADSSENTHSCYIAKDFNLCENKNSDNYELVNFTVSKTSGYISTFGYDENFDWIFIPTETNGTSSLPIGDYYYHSYATTGYKSYPLGGSYNTRGFAGSMCLYLTYNSTHISNGHGGRLVYMPTKNIVEE